MRYKIRLGVPEMENLWNALCSRKASETWNKEESQLYKKWGKAMYYLSINPLHNSLHSHEIKPLSERYGLKVWQSYLENKTSRARRMYWVYGPGKDEITIIGLEPHPEDKKNGAYDKISLSSLRINES